MKVNPMRPSVFSYHAQVHLYPKSFSLELPPKRGIYEYVLIQVPPPHKHIPPTQPLRIPRFLLNVRVVLEPSWNPYRPLGRRGAGRLGLAEDRDEVRSDVVAHPVVAVGGEVEAIVPVLLAGVGGKGVIGYRGVEVEGIA